MYWIWTYGRRLSLLATSEHPASSTAAARDSQLNGSCFYLTLFCLLLQHCVPPWPCPMCCPCHAGPEHILCAIPSRALNTVSVRSLIHVTCALSVYRSPRPCAMYSPVTRILPVSPHCSTCQPWHSMHLPIPKLTALQTVQVSVTKLTFHLQSEEDSRNLKGCI